MPTTRVGVLWMVTVREGDRATSYGPFKTLQAAEACGSTWERKMANLVRRPTIAVKPLFPPRVSWRIRHWSA